MAGVFQNETTGSQKTGPFTSLQALPVFFGIFHPRSQQTRLLADKLVGVRRPRPVECWSSTVCHPDAIATGEKNAVPWTNSAICVLMSKK